MSDAPERRMIYDDNPEQAPKVVWIQWSALYDSLGAFDHVLEDDFLRRPDLDHMPIRYVREDAAEVEALRKENERLKEALTQERLENLWNAYNTGHENDGKWTHAFMSDGEWLVQEIGMDPTLGWYDASEIKRRIPDAAARADLQGET